MQLSSALLTLVGSAAAFAPSTSNTNKATALNAFSAEELPGALAPVGFFDPLGFAEKADENTMKRSVRPS